MIVATFTRVTVSGPSGPTTQKNFNLETFPGRFGLPTQKSFPKVSETGSRGFGPGRHLEFFGIPWPTGRKDPCKGPVGSQPHVGFPHDMEISEVQEVRTKAGHSSEDFSQKCLSASGPKNYVYVGRGYQASVWGVRKTLAFPGFPAEKAEKTGGYIQRLDS